MNSVKRLSGFVLIAAAFAVLPMHSAAFADDSDIFGANIQPNVLVLLDNSGSMDEVIGSYPYGNGTTYSVINKCGSAKTSACSTPVVYKAGAGGTYTLYKNTVADVNKTQARTALNSSGTGPEASAAPTLTSFWVTTSTTSSGFARVSTATVRRRSTSPSGS